MDTNMDLRKNRKLTEKMDILRGRKGISKKSSTSIYKRKKRSKKANQDQEHQDQEYQEQDPLPRTVLQVAQQETASLTCGFCVVSDVQLLVSYCRQCRLVICDKCTGPHTDSQVVGHKVEKYRSYLAGDPTADTWYSVESIEDQKVIKGEVKYYMKWRGYPASANTWEPAGNISEDLIIEYENLRRNECHKHDMGWD